MAPVKLLSTFDFKIIFRLHSIYILYKNIQHLYSIYTESIQKVYRKSESGTRNNLRIKEFGKRGKCNNIEQ